MAIYKSGLVLLSGDVIQPVAGPWALMGAIVLNGGPNQYILFFDSPTIPPDGTQADIPWQIGPGSTAINFCPIGNVAYARQTSQGWPFYNGISWCNSLTAPAKAIAAANIWLTLVYA